MADSLNKVMLMGNITRDIELKHTQSNQAVATIGIAMNRSWKTPDGEKREDVTFVDCEAWGRTAEVIAQYFSKGKPIIIEGRLKLDTWKDKETGANKSRLKVVVDGFFFVGGGSGGGGGGGGGEGGGYSKPASAPGASRGSSG
ncbi:MAG: single-stranded DNA-binding protein, partial [Phycisphaerales bacterium]